MKTNQMLFDFSKSSNTVIFNKNKFTMQDIQKWLQAYCDNKDWVLITDTQYGLNVDRDETADRGTDNDKDALFLNIIENGNMTSTNGVNFTLTRTFEIGLFKRCIKETEGTSYYADIQYLLKQMIQLYNDLQCAYDYPISSASYESGVDELDSNNVVVKLTFSVDDLEAMCPNTDIKTEWELGYEAAGGDKEKIEKLQAQVVELTKQVSDKQKQINDLTNEVADYQAQVETLNNEINNLKSQIETLNAQIADLQAQITEKDKTISEQSDTISNLNDTISNLNSQVTDLTNQLSAKEAEIENLNAQIAVKDSEITALKVQVNAYKQAIDDLQEQCNQLSQTIAERDATITSLNEQVNNLTSQLTSLQDEYDTLNSSYTKLQSDYSTLQTENTNLKTQVADLNTQVENLTKQVADLTAELPVKYQEGYDAGYDEGYEKGKEEGGGGYQPDFVDLGVITSNLTLDTTVNDGDVISFDAIVSAGSTDGNYDSPFFLVKDSNNVYKGFQLSIGDNDIGYFYAGYNTDITTEFDYTQTRVFGGSGTCGNCKATITAVVGSSKDNVTYNVTYKTGSTSSGTVTVVNSSSYPNKWPIKAGDITLVLQGFGSVLPIRSIRISNIKIGDKSVKINVSSDGTYSLSID